MDGLLRLITRCLVTPCLLILLAAPGMAQDSTSHFSSVNLQIGVGAGYAVGRLGDFADYGPAATAGLLVRPMRSAPEMSFVLSGSYRYFPQAGSNMGDFSIVAGAVDLRLTPGYESPSHVYLLGGLGFGRVALQKARAGQYLVRNKSSETGPLAEAGAGIEYTTGMHGYFIELRVSNVFSSSFGDYRYAQMTVGAIF